MSQRKLVAYYRVSTDRQGRSGLGLDAQRASVFKYRDDTDSVLVGEFTEVESGKRSDRLELGRAIAQAKALGATLVFAKLDRLSRNAHFLLGLVESGAELVFCDLPNVSGPIGKFMLTQMAAVAELEAGLIGQRTRDALKAAKERGVKLGGHRGKMAAFRSAEAKRTKADRFAVKLIDTIAALRAEGVTSASGIARALNNREIPTISGGIWQAVQVQRVEARLAV